MLRFRSQPTQWLTLITLSRVNAQVAREQVSMNFSSVQNGDLNFVNSSFLYVMFMEAVDPTGGLLVGPL